MYIKMPYCGKLRKHSNLSFTLKHSLAYALAGVAQWVEHRSTNQKVAGLIPSQGTFLGCGTCPQLGVCERQPIGVSLSLSLTFSLKINK